MTKCRKKIRMDGSYRGSKSHWHHIINLYYVFFAKVTFCEELEFRFTSPLSISLWTMIAYLQI